MLHSHTEFQSSHGKVAPERLKERSRRPRVDDFDVATDERADRIIVFPAHVYSRRKSDCDRVITTEATIFVGAFRRTEKPRALVCADANYAGKRREGKVTDGEIE